MKICYVADSIVPSRTANSIHIMKMCNAYANLGHRVTLIVPKWKEGVESFVEDIYTFYGVNRNFNIHRIPIPRWRISRAYWGFIFPVIAGVLCPDVIHTRSLGVAWGLTNFLSLPTIYEFHVPPRTKGPSYDSFKKTVGSRSIKALVCVTKALADAVQPLLPYTLRVVVAPDGVDSHALNKALSKEEARSKVGLDGEKRRIIVYAGSLYKGRGVELICELAGRLEDHLFVVVGGTASSIHELQRRNDHLNNLRFVGFVSPSLVPTYLCAADVLLMPYGNQVEVAGGSHTTDYCSPIKMFEYMASGRPILSSTLPVLQEVLRDSVNALLIPYGAANEWVEALKVLRVNILLGSRLGENARRDVEQYTWEKRAGSILKVVQ